jgi:hypothetical protein
MSDTNMPTNAQPSKLTIYPKANGSCSVRNPDGSRGGFFVGYEAARHFVNTESAWHQRTGKTYSATANVLFARTIEGRRRDCELFCSDSAGVSFTTCRQS